MMDNRAAKTALDPMVIVAVEQNFPQGCRLIRDDVAYRFLPLGLRLLVKLTRFSPIRGLLTLSSERRARGVWGGIASRKRYIDDRLTEALGSEIDAVVNLGAGLDTRAYRLPALSTLSVFEVDLPENIADKRHVLHQVYGKIPDHVTLVPLDLEHQDLESVLTSHGYQIQQKSFFIWEAVTQYLTESGVRKTFSFLAKANPGSKLVFTYIRKDFIDGVASYGSGALYKAFRVEEQLWRFGMVPELVGAFLNDYDWKELEQAGSHEYIAQYVKPSGRLLQISEIERAVYAEKM
jgi:methyltransferase (TIGR00027 family)